MDGDGRRLVAMKSTFGWEQDRQSDAALSYILFAHFG